MIELNEIIREAFNQSNSDKIKFSCSVTMINNKIYLVNDKIKIEFKRGRKINKNDK